MLQNATKNFAIIVTIFKSLFHVVDAKYCAFEIHGEPKYYVCTKSEYCCNFGCCVYPGFQIYHLWHYWLLVIVMFLICSGGGWWYRYWLQGRYTRATSSILPSSSSSSSRVRTAVTTQRSSGSTANTVVCQQGQHANISYNSARNTVLLHRMWKGPHRRDRGAQRMPSSSTHFQNTNVVLNDCPYYQLYGPPPSYETVIAQCRGKNTDTITCNDRPGTNELNLQYNSPILRCYTHSMQPNSHSNLSQSNCLRYNCHDNCQQGDFENFPQSTSSADAITIVNEPETVPEHQATSQVVDNSGEELKNNNITLHGSLPSLCQRLTSHASSSSSASPPRLHCQSVFRRAGESMPVDLTVKNTNTILSSPSQTNPSDNVILARSSDSIVINNNLADNRAPRSSRSFSNDSRNTESKLNRSQSLV